MVHCAICRRLAEARVSGAAPSAIADEFPVSDMANYDNSLDEQIDGVVEASQLWIGNSSDSTSLYRYDGVFFCSQLPPLWSGACRGVV